MKRKILSFLLVAVMIFGLFSFSNQIVSANSDKVNNRAISSMGANDTTLNGIIDSTLSSSDGIDAWQKYLNDEWRGTWDSFTWKNLDDSLVSKKWSGVESNIVADAINNPEINPMVIPEIKDGAYQIYYGEQLLYALQNTTTNKLIIKQDIDMNGYENSWPGITTTLTNYEFDGDNHIIYNLGSQKSFIAKTVNTTFKNITFDSAKLVSTSEKLLSIIGMVEGTTIDHVRVQNTIIFSAYPEYNATMGIESYAGPFGKTKQMQANYVATSNNFVYALKAHVGGAFAASEKAIIDNCYSVDSTIIAGGNHSGGFISCGNGGNTVQRCFTNNTVYGNKETGVFIGTLVDNYAGNDSFVDCYASGTIEGIDKLGGFIGYVDAFGSTYSANFKNCYSTSIVGMRNGGTNLGGFLGQTSGKSVFENCYAAGEVGSIDVNLSDGRSSTVGGFLGMGDGYAKFTNCYYDKQTTAMREWESGKAKDAIGTATGETGINNIKGLKGVLTSDSGKFGAGLASQPTAIVTDFDLETGFTGFTGDVNGGLISNADWIYDGGNKDASLHNCMYPQLSIFFNSPDAFIRAFSYASVATVHEQVWQNCSHGQELPKTTYDTVRDMTLRFTLTSYVNNDKDTNNVGIKWTKSGENSNIYGEEKPVIGFFQQAENSTYGRKYWTADKFAPGTEWVKVEFTISQDGKTVVGSRRLRIIPTSNITPGVDQIDLLQGDTYNHAKDVYMAYSTAQRLASNASDITTGVYPDAYPFDASDIRNTIQSNVSYGKDITAQFNTDQGNFTVGGEHMTDGARQVSSPQPNNIINVYLYAVKEFKEVNGSDTQIIYGTRDEALLSPEALNGDKGTERQVVAQTWAKKLSGKESFIGKDTGRYLIEYEWILPDGRFTRDSKMIMIQNGEHTISTEIRNTSDNKLNKSSIMNSIIPFSYGGTIPTPIFDKATDSATIKVNHFTPVNMAFKPVNTNVTIDKIEFKFNISDIASSSQDQVYTIDNVSVGTEFVVPVEYYYSSYEENGNYYAKKVKTEKKYKLEQDSSGYFYLTLQQTFNDANTKVERYDTECDVKATIYITDPNRNTTGTVNVAMNTFENDKQVFINQEFAYGIIDIDGNVVHNFNLTSLEASNQSFALEEGTYTIQQLSDNGYSLKKVVINGEEKVAPFTFTITSDEETKIVFTNGKTVLAPDEPDKEPVVPPVTPDDGNIKNPEDTNNKNVDTSDSSRVAVYVLYALGSLLISLCLYRKSEIE